MYRNYGDKDFFEHGVLADTDHSDTVIDLIRCEPYLDEEDHYQYARMQVDIEDPWIDRKAVMSYAGMTENKFDPVGFAVAAADYYGWNCFGADDYGVFYNWRDMDRASIEKELSHEWITLDDGPYQPDQKQQRTKRQNKREMEISM